MNIDDKIIAVVNKQIGNYIICMERGLIKPCTCGWNLYCSLDACVDMCIEFNASEDLFHDILMLRSEALRLK